MAPLGAKWTSIAGLIILSIMSSARGSGRKVCASALLRGLVGLLVIHAGVAPALSWGAMAVGTTGNFAKDGFAFGAAVNQPSEDSAKSSALDTCGKYQGAPKMAAACGVVSTFHGQCFALAFDPQAGTPGVGWAIAADQASAQQQALANCQATAGAERRPFCKLGQSACDAHD